MHRASHRKKKRGFDNGKKHISQRRSTNYGSFTTVCKNRNAGKIITNRYGSKIKFDLGLSHITKTFYDYIGKTEERDSISGGQANDKSNDSQHNDINANCRSNK